MPSVLLRVYDTKQSSVDRLLLQMEDSVHCHRETERNSRVSLRTTQLFLTVSMRLGSRSSNGDLLDVSTERRLTLAEVEPSNGFGGLLTDVGRHFRLFVFHAMPEVTTFWENVPSALLRVGDTKQSSADRLL